MTTRALLILLLVLSPLSALAADVLVVQSVRSAMYEEALKGFRKGCGAETETLVLSDYADPELARVLQEERPRLVLAIGDGALALLRKVRRTPVLALMALGIASHDKAPSNVTGVELFVKPEQYFALFKKLKAMRVGVVYDPSRTGAYLKLARSAAKQHGVELVPREVSDSRQVVAQLATLKGEVDALWLIPDGTAVTRETLEGYFLFGQRQSVPVFSFSAAHLKLGALLALEVDRLELGKQAGEMAQQLLRGVDPADLPVSSPRKVSLAANEAVARRLRYPTELIAQLLKGANRRHCEE